MTLKADVVGNMAEGISVIWSRRDGRPINAKHRQRGSVLYIRNADSSDAGLYVCAGTDRRGSVVFEFMANLIIAAAPQIRLEPQQQTVRPGESPSIECRVISGEQPVTIQWIREDNQPLSAETVTQRGPVLQFQTIAVSDEGRYVCRASNRAGFSQSVAEVVVIDDGRSGGDRIERLSSSEGATIDLPCRLSSSTDLNWSKEGGQLPINHQVVNTALKLTRVRVEDTGRYVCTSQGRTQYVDLTVQRVTVNPGKPTITISPSSESPSMGEAFEARCEVEGLGGRRRIVSWQRIDGEMPPSLEVRGNVLRSSALGENTSGLYRCIVQTEDGTFYEDFQFNVTAGQEGLLPPPVFN